MKTKFKISRILFLSLINIILTTSLFVTLSGKNSIASARTTPNILSNYPIVEALSFTPVISETFASIPIVNSNPTITVHMGSYSIDHNNLTSAQIDSAIKAVVDNIPQVDFIAIGTYLDYPEQIRLWANAIHKYGKKVWVRSAGFNSWQGTFGSQANGSAAIHIILVNSWINNNYSIFRDGDIFEPAPDEASNGKYWFIKYGPKGVGSNSTSKTEFNNFIKSTVSVARSAFDRHNLGGVIAEFYADNPSVIKDALFPDTVNLLKFVGTDNYPERLKTTPENGAEAMKSELQKWIVGTHNNKSWNITFGPNIYIQFDEETQTKAYLAELAVILGTVPSLHGITIWQFGEVNNWPKSRLFNYTSGTWKPRSITRVIGNQ